MIFSRRYFSEHLPEDIGQHLIQSGETGAKCLAEMAGELWANKKSWVSQIGGSKSDNEVNVVQPGQRQQTSSQSQHLSGLCRIHYRWGDKANECIPQCMLHDTWSMINQGNGQAGHQ